MSERTFADSIWTIGLVVINVCTWAVLIGAVIIWLGC